MFQPAQRMTSGPGVAESSSESDWTVCSLLSPESAFMGALVFSNAAFEDELIIPLRFVGVGSLSFEKIVGVG